MIHREPLMPIAPDPDEKMTRSEFFIELIDHWKAVRDDALRFDTESCRVAAEILNGGINLLQITYGRMLTNLESQAIQIDFPYIDIEKLKLPKKEK